MAGLSVEAVTCAVVVNWKGAEDTIRCLASLFAQSVPLRIVVCDNGSADDSLERIADWLEHRLPAWQRNSIAPATAWVDPQAPVVHGAEAVCLLPLQENRGYAGGLNAGVRWAQAHWGTVRFWLLNNDLEASPDALRALQAAHAAVPRAGLCGSVLMDWDRAGEVQAVAGSYRRWLGVGSHLRELPPGDVYREADYPVGASLYVEQDFLDRVGLMDESYFLYYEEMDWAERGRSHGFVPVVALASRLRHKEGASTGSRGGVRHKSLLSEHYGVVNRLRITRRFWPQWLPLVWLSLVLVAADRLLHGEFARAALVVQRMFSPRLWWPVTRPPRPGIVYCQLNDDDSGSPRVLVHSIRALASRFPDPLAFVSSSQSGGFLGRSGVPLRRYPFRKSLRHPWLLLSYAAGQLGLVLKLLWSRPLPGAPVYVNTSLPVGGALYGVLTRRPVVFHSHEIPHSLLEKVAFAITVRCSTLVLCVSRSHKAQLPLPLSCRSRAVVVPNALDPEFARLAAQGQKEHRRQGRFCVLYATSALTPQKGLPEFVQLALALRHREDIQLVLAAPRHEAAAIPPALPPNVVVRCGEPSLAPLYGAAGVVLNLSRPDLSVETFGLTALEAMAFATPVIVPPAGGPAELVRDGEEGYHVDPRETERLVETVCALADDGARWQRLSAAARRRAADFGFAAYEQSLVAALDAVLPRGAHSASTRTTEP